MSGSPFTSVGNGFWNDGATWGNTSPGVKGTDWPGNANNVVTIAANHTVTYNVSETNQLGLMTINGLLTFSISMNTLLSFGNVLCVINDGGELRVGAPGAVIPKNYTAQISMNSSTTGRGFTVNVGGKITMYGDPTYYGSDFDTTLAITAEGATHIHTTDDMSSKWNQGDILLLHKNALYADKFTDFMIVTISSFSGTQINTVETIPVTFLAGGYVLNETRNVSFTKTGASIAVSNMNLTNSLTISDNNTTNKINLSDVLFTATLIRYAGASYKSIMNITNSVFRNSGSSLQNLSGSNVNRCIFSTASTPFTCSNDSTVENSYFCASGAAVSFYFSNIRNCKIFGFGAMGGSNLIGNCNKYTSCDIFSSSGAEASGYNNIFFDFYFYLNTVGIRSQNGIYYGGAAGFDRAGNTAPNTADFDVVSMASIMLKNIKISDPPVVAGRDFFVTGNINSGKIQIENYNKVFGDNRIIYWQGDLKKVLADGLSDHPSVRNGGNSSVIEAIPQSWCSTMNGASLQVFDHEIWLNAGVGVTLKYYLQTTFVALDSTKIALYADYYSSGTDGTVSTLQSVQGITTRANQSDWSQFLSVNLIPQQTGWVKTYICLMGYESDMKVWIDPQVQIG